MRRHVALRGMETDLQDEARRATDLLAGKTVLQVWRRSAREVGIEFLDGTRLFVDACPDGVELSITGGAESDTD